MLVWTLVLITEPVDAKIAANTVPLAEARHRMKEEREEWKYIFTSLPKTLNRDFSLFSESNEHDKLLWSPQINCITINVHA